MARAAHPAGGQSGTGGDGVTARGPGGQGGTPASGPEANPKTVLEAAEIHRALTRIAHEIIERTRGAEAGGGPPGGAGRRARGRLAGHRT